MKVEQTKCMEDDLTIIANYYGKEIQMLQLIEEMAELTQAISKHFRICGKGQPLDNEITFKSVEQNLIEELADVSFLIDQVIYLIGCEDEVNQVRTHKIKRTIERIGEHIESN